MLLTVSTTHRPASDLGYLLHKHPDRVQRFPGSFGIATVCFPEVSEERCTAALLLEVDPVRWSYSRPRNARREGPGTRQSPYVNDWSYAASSLVSVALSDVFGTARSGRCAARPELAESAIPLEIEIPVLPCRSGPSVAHRLFKPLGWRVRAERIPLDDRFPSWGDSRYLRLRLTGVVRLADALNQLYVLLPVLSESKHYWQGSDEVDKLIRAGGSWLAGHPERTLISRRYFGRVRRLSDVAAARLAELDDALQQTVDPVTKPDEVPKQRSVPLDSRRHDAVHQTLLDLGARSVIDLGCGPGNFLERLLRTPQFTRVAGVDVSTGSLRKAAQRLRVSHLGDGRSPSVDLFQSALTYEDARFAGYDAAVLMEVIEHLELNRLPALERVVFGASRPRAVLVTTPNSEYNVLFNGLTGMRHADHRFEWDRATFADWSDRVATSYGYAVWRRGIGDPNDALGAPTQMAVFSRDQ